MSVAGAAKTPRASPPSSYSAPMWLPGGHLQTIYAALFCPRPRISYRRERWITPDADFIDVDWADRPGDGPVVALFHGLEGSSRSHYAQSIVHALSIRGSRSAVLHFRGCSGESNRLPRAYHSGDSGEIDWILRRLKSLNPGRHIFAVGVSLGGNALLKWLGEQGEHARDVVSAATAVCAPVDLLTTGDWLGEGLNRLYTRHFLGSLVPKSLEKLERFPGLYDARAVACSTTLRKFDNLVTAPLHGFADTDDYWTRASSKPWLKSIRVPTLMINALNDPFVPARILPTVEEVAPEVTLEYTPEGGHAGFVSGPFPGKFEWLPMRIARYFAGHL